VKFTWNSSVPSSAIDRMKPPTFGAVMSKSASGKVIEPATWTVPSTRLRLGRDGHGLGHAVQSQVANQRDV
jgi:hypothetical protein